MKYIFITKVLLLLFLIGIVRSEWTLGASDLTENNFESSSLSGWSDSRVYTCPSYDTRSMVGGY